MEKYIDIIKSAYRKFKTKVYYENSLFYLKQKFYEDGMDESEVVDRVIKLLETYNHNKELFIQRITEEINILIYPKKVIEQNQNNNDDNIENTKCFIESTMPVIDCSIEYYIIDMVTSMYLLRDVEYFRKLENRCSYTYSINENLFINSDLNLNSKLVFNSYSYSYSQWYNNAKIKIMENIENYIPVIIFKEDYKNFYFKNDIPVEHEYLNELSDCGKYFFNVLKEIIKIYTKKLSKTLKSFNKDLNFCVPVGFNSSLILAELISEQFDKEILKEKTSNNQFIYYGRYADDMLFIFEYDYDSKLENINNYLKCYDKFLYKLNEDKCSKSIITNINKIEGSLKLMNTFCTSIIDFNDRMDILTDEEYDKEEVIDSFIKPKTFKLRRLLMDEYIGYSHIELSKQNEKYNEIDRLINNLFCNSSYLLYYKLWIDIVKYLKVRNNDLINVFLKNLKRRVKDVEIIDEDKEKYKSKIKVEKDVKKSLLGILNIAENESIRELNSLDNLEERAKITTLYEYILNNSKELKDYNEYKKEFTKINGFIKKPNFHVKSWDKNFLDIYIKGKRKFKIKKEINIGLLMNKITENEIIKTITDNNIYANNITFENLKYAFREASKNKVDFLVAHECYLPVSWIDMAAYFCQKYKVSFICGLQYENFKNTCKNQICVLQYIESSPYYNVIPIIREKNNYSPHEDCNFVFNKKDIRENDNKLNYVIHTNYLNYTTFLCYELTDIVQRALYKDKVDCVFVPVMNRDTEYFDNIINSYSRDIFSYIIQSNSTIYRGSAICAPFDTNNKIIATGKGGENNRLIVDKIHIKALHKYKITYFTKLAKALNRCQKCPKLCSKCNKKFNNCANLKSKDIPYVKSPCR